MLLPAVHALLLMPDRPPPLIPSHVAWPMFIVLLLAISLTAVVVTVVAARSDGGVRLVETQAPPSAVP